MTLINHDRWRIRRGQSGVKKTTFYQKRFHAYRCLQNSRLMPTIRNSNNVICKDRKIDIFL